MQQRIAVVGCGYWGPNLIRNLMEIPQVEVPVVCDRDVQRAKSVQRHYPNLKITRSFEAVLDDPEIDGVILATPAETHAALAEQSLNAGKHTFVEKPLALTSSDCHRLIELADRQQRILMVGHTFLYNDAVTRLKQLVDNGDLGEIWYLHARRLNLGQIRQDVNAMWNLAPHDVSILLYLLQETPCNVIARGYDFLQQGMHDLVSMTLEFPSGKVGFIEVSWLSPNKVRDMTVVGSKKMALYNDVDPDAKLTLYDKGVENLPTSKTGNFGEFQFRLRYGDVHIPHVRMREPLSVELTHFAECIRKGTQPLTNGQNGLQVVEVLEAAQLSLTRAGSAVSLKPRLAPAA
jgi:predicted dehydrogenase